MEELKDYGIIILILERVFSWLKLSKPHLLLKEALEFIATVSRNKSKKQDITNLKKELNKLERDNEHLKSINVSLLNKMNKSEEIISILDKMQDSLNLKRAGLFVFSNGTVDLTGAGNYFFSLEYEKHHYSEYSLKEVFYKRPIDEISSWVKFMIDEPNYDSLSHSIPVVDSLIATYSTSRIVSTILIVNETIVGVLFLSFAEYSKEVPNVYTELIVARNKIESAYKKYS